ncbi:Hypothetical protein PHPALM_526 [Phytophthora palmivora]|uniref:Uncharacterized protein n=1 Tax=Phytophthora palmivora TaxID=4796 RepID=A0A2P4YUM4_9STRA|nr:Hypothetical protein PHPALM_526 [Phytophthora palmivora]
MENIGSFVKLPRQPGENSFIFDWGVRVQFTKDVKTKVNAENLMLLSKGRTSQAVKHLRLVYQLKSPKTKKEIETKTKRDENVEHLQQPDTTNLLLETLRIINHNVPLRMGEYEEYRLHKALAVKDEMRTTITAERIEA